MPASRIDRLLAGLPARARVIQFSLYCPTLTRNLVPSSFRIDPHLAWRLREVAARQAVPVSAVVREAITRYCDAVLAADARARLADVIGVLQSEGGRAPRTGRAFKDALAARRLR